MFSPVLKRIASWIYNGNSGLRMEIPLKNQSKSIFLKFWMNCSGHGMDSGHLSVGSI